MRRDNPACYECPRGRSGLHTWQRKGGDKTAHCVECGLKLNERDTAEVFEDEDDRAYRTFRATQLKN